jgi:hypothetical protein
MWVFLAMKVATPWEEAGLRVAGTPRARVTRT